MTTLSMTAWRCEKSASAVKSLVFAIEATRHVKDAGIKHALLFGLHPALWAAMKVASDACDDPGLFSPARHEALMNNAQEIWAWLDDAEEGHGHRVDVPSTVARIISENQETQP